MRSKKEVRSLLGFIRLLAIIFFVSLFLCSSVLPENGSSGRSRARDLGIDLGRLETGKLNAITDVPGVKVGHKTLIRGNRIRTGVTAVIPHPGNIFSEKLPAAIYCFNGFGKLAGYTQVEELGKLETPIVLTNTLAVGTAMIALVRYTLRQPGNERVRSVNAVVGETNDGFLNDIRGLPVQEGDVLAAIQSAGSGPVLEGSVGAGTGTLACGFKGGIGTSSRVTLRIGEKRYVVGVLVQSNFGRELVVNGIRFPRETRQLSDLEKNKRETDGSCMIVIATDAPLSSPNLKRLAKRAFAGMARTTPVMSNSSGDYAIAFSTAYRIPEGKRDQAIKMPELLSNDAMTDLFQAAEEATQEAIYNSIFMATTICGFQGHCVEAISLENVIRLLKNRN